MLFLMFTSKSEPYHVNVSVNGVHIQMALDTGAALTVINEATYNRIRQESDKPCPLQPSEKKLKSYMGHPTKVEARYGGGEIILPVYIVGGGGPNLMGRDWLCHFEVDLTTVNLIEPDGKLQMTLEKYSDVFSDELGCVNGPPVKLTVHESEQPKFYKPRPVPYSFRAKVEQELENLQAKGIISHVQTSPWAAPVVPMLKKDGRVGLCGDFKLTVNKVSPTETYPLPRVEELFTNLAGGKYFTKLDMSNAHLQLPLDADSKQYVTINTYKGLFQYNRLPFGVASPPAILQHCMDTLLQGMRGVSVYLNDIPIAGASMEENLENLEAVLQKL